VRSFGCRAQKEGIAAIAHQRAHRDEAVSGIVEADTRATAKAAHLIDQQIQNDGMPALTNT
jgi:hypothetical protein